MKKILLLVVLTAFISCGQKQEQTTLKVEGLEGNYTLTTYTKDTLISTKQGEKKMLDLEGIEDKKFPLFTYVGLNGNPIGKVIEIVKGDNIVISVDQDRNVTVKSNLENAKENFLNANQNIKDLKNKYETLSEKRKEISPDDKEALTNIFAELKETYDILCTSIIDAIEKGNKNSYTELIMFNSVYGGFAMKDLESNTRVTEIAEVFEKNIKNDMVQSMIDRCQKYKISLEAQENTSVGKDIIDIVAKGLDRKVDIKLSDVVANNKAVLLKFWASWCSPCIKSFPRTLEIEEKFKGKKFKIFAYSLDKENGENKWKNAIKKHHLENWIHCSDLMFWNSIPPKQYGVIGIPTEVLIIDGKIAGRNLSKEELIKKLNEVL